MQVKDIIKKIKLIEIRTRKKLAANLMGQYFSAVKGQGMIFSEARQYQFGDDMRRIDWNKTAHFQEPFVKVMEEEKELNIMFLVDISASMGYGTKSALKYEYIAEICASIGFSAMNSNENIGLILFSDKIYKIVPPQKGKKHLLAIISSILSAQYTPSKADISNTLKHVMNVFKRKSLLFLFSDFNEEIENKTLRVAARKYELLGIRIADEKDNEIPDIGYAEFQDVETGKKVWVNTSSPRFRYDFAENKRNEMKKTKQLFEKSSAGFLNLDTKTDYAKELYKYFNAIK